MRSVSPLVNPVHHQFRFCRYVHFREYYVSTKYETPVSLIQRLPTDKADHSMINDQIHTNISRNRHQCSEIRETGKTLASKIAEHRNKCHGTGTFGFLVQ